MVKVKNDSTLTEVVVNVKRVMKTITGGTALSFAVLVVVGDKKGNVGFGSGKAKEVSIARAKAYEAAKKSIMRIPMKEGRTVHHRSEGIFDSSQVIVRSAPAGTGVIAGGPMRAVFECLGVQDVVAKSLGSNNPYTVVAATFEALKGTNSPKSVADRRGKPVSEIIKRRNMTLNPSNNSNKE